MAGNMAGLQYNVEFLDPSRLDFVGKRNGIHTTSGFVGDAFLFRWSHSQITFPLGGGGIW